MSSVPESFGSAWACGGMRKHHRGLTRGEESEGGGAAVQTVRTAPHFLMFLRGGLKNNAKIVSRNGTKIIKSEVLEAPCFKGGSQEASRAPPGSILERFWNHFGTMLVNFSNIFLMFFARIV